jgi:hypothetical protein
MNCEIRLATEKDEGLIRKIHKESSKQIGSFNLFYIWDNYISRKNKYKYYVIDGVGFVRHGYSKKLKCYTVKEFGVLNEYKGKGYAEKLFNHCKRPIYLTCNIDNDRGNAFYKKIGMKLKGVKTSKNGKTKMNAWVI